MNTVGQPIDLRERGLEPAKVVANQKGLREHN